MKKLFFALTIAASLVASHLIYPETMVVIDTTDGITMEAFSGHSFVVNDDPEDILVGDVLSVLMYDPGTPDDVTDDIVLDFRCAGWTLS